MVIIEDPKKSNPSSVISIPDWTSRSINLGKYNVLKYINLLLYIKDLAKVIIHVNTVQACFYFCSLEEI